MSGICHIVCGGPRGDLSFDLCADDMLIAADAGYAHCIEAGLDPDLFVGDMDSLPAEYAASITCECVELPREKDDTDTLAACREGLASGYKDFVLHDALGGDVGHMIANIQTLAFLREQGARGELCGNDQRAFLVLPEDGVALFEEEPGTRVSIFAFGGPAQGVDLHGLHWELDDADFSCDLPLGVSNEVEKGVFELHLDEGQLLVIIG